MSGYQLNDYVLSEKGKNQNQPDKKQPYLYRGGEFKIWGSWYGCSIIVLK